MKKNKISVIIFNENHWGCLATLNNELPNILLEDEQNLYQGLEHLRESLKIKWSNELLNYIVNAKGVNEYIFIVATKEENDQLNWVSGSDVEKLGELKINSKLLNDLIERFKNGFILDGTRYIEEE